MMDDLFAVLNRLPANADTDIEKLPIKTKPDKTNNTRKPVKAKAPIDKGASVIEVLTNYLPEGISNTNDMRSALSDGYRIANGINEPLKAKDAQGLSKYLQSLGAEEINRLIQVKKEAIRAKAKAKRLSRK